VSRSTLQRVGYRLADGKLYRDYWTVLDRQQNSVAVPALLIDKVKSFSLRFMDGNRQWQTNWPAGSVGGSGMALSRRLPLAIEITLTLDDWGELKRIVEVVS
jgi:general secretion pathway protein J